MVVLTKISLIELRMKADRECILFTMPSSVVVYTLVSSSMKGLLCRIVETIKPVRVDTVVTTLSETSISAAPVDATCC